MVEDFLTKHLKDVKIVLADVHVFSRRGADVVDEVGPGGIPLVLDNLNEDAVAFRQDVLQRFRQRLGSRVLENDVHYVTFERFALVFRQSQPFLLNKGGCTLIASSRSTSIKILV
jgi:hypothetical protein